MSKCSKVFLSASVSFSLSSFSKIFLDLSRLSIKLNASLANIGFSGRDIDGEQTSAVENINVENLTFDIITPSRVINPKKKSKIKFDGWYYSLGIGIKFNHLKKNK